MHDICISFCFFFFKQKTAYEMRISDWSSDVCSSDLTAQPEIRCFRLGFHPLGMAEQLQARGRQPHARRQAIGESGAHLLLQAGQPPYNCAVVQTQRTPRGSNAARAPNSHENPYVVPIRYRNLCTALMHFELYVRELDKCKVATQELKRG